MTDAAQTVNQSPSPAPNGWRKLAFAFKAIEVRLRFIAIIVVIGLIFGYWETLKNHWDKWTRPAVAGAALAAGTEFYCPMHPNVVRDKPEPDGTVPKCPICAMPLSKRKKGAPPELPPGVLSRVQLSPDRVSMAGVATEQVGYEPLVREVRTVGYVTYDESKLSQVTSRTSGYVEKLHVDRTFQTVTKGDPLAEVYSPALYEAAQELVLLRSGKLDNLVSSSKEKLRLLGLGEKEIDEIWKTGRADARLVLRSSQTGHVLRKNVVEGSRIEEGQVLFEVADLSTVWVEADVYERDLGLIRQGQKVEATVEAFPGRVFEGTVALVHPHLERATRTNRVRFELANSNHDLRPGMYATVRLTTPVAETEPFRTEIAKRQAQPAAADAASLVAWQRNCPVTGLKLGSMGEPLPVSVADKTVYICCPACEDKLKDSPAEYVAKLAPPPADAVLTVPQTAVIDTGEQQLVYVEREPGMFEGVEVELGPRSGDKYPVLSGLSPGDRVASAGSFLIDAETRLNPTAASAYFGATGGPQSGGAGAATQRPAAKADEPSDAPQIEFKPEHLANIAKLPAADQALAKAQKLCPVTEKPLGFMGVPVKLTVEGETVFLCCRACVDKVKADPRKHLDQVLRWRAEQR